MDKPALRPLPSDPYEPAMYKRAKVHVDYHVEIDRRFHSLPRALIGWTIDACVTHHVVEILHGGRRVGRHPRAFSQAGDSTISDHM